MKTEKSMTYDELVDMVKTTNHPYCEVDHWDISGNHYKWGWYVDVILEEWLQDVLDEDDEITQDGHLITIHGTFVRNEQLYSKGTKYILEFVDTKSADYEYGDL